MKRNDNSAHSKPPSKRTSSRSSYNYSSSSSSSSSCSSDDDSMSILEVLPPVKKVAKASTTVKASAKPFKPATSSLRASASINNTTPASPDYGKLSSTDDSSSDSDDPFSVNLPKRPMVAIKRSAASVSASASTANKRVTNPSTTITTTTTKSRPKTSTTAAQKQADIDRRKRDRLDKAKQKEQEKQLRIRKREDVKRQRDQQKQAKKQQTQQAQQANGRYAHKEVVVLLDEQLLENGEHALHGVLSEHFLIQQHDLPGCKRVVQWIRRDFLSGGAEKALQGLEAKKFVEFEHLHRILVFVDATEFIPLLRRGAHAEDDDYPALEAYVTNIISSWQKNWQADREPKISFLLFKIPDALDQLWIDQRQNARQASSQTSASSSNQQQRQRQQQQLPTESEFQDALQWLLIQFRVESILCKSIEMFQSTVFKMTRAIAEAPYKTHVTELQCIRKIKMTDSADSDFLKAKDTWARQLQTFPRISDLMARNAMQYFPTLRSVLDAYERDPEGAPTLLAGAFTDARRHPLLSQSVYRFLTSKNPSELV